MKKIGGGEDEHSHEILGRKVEFLQATEPTNIIWENRHIKGINYMSRVVVAFIVILFMLSLTFSFILYAKKFAIDNEKLFSKIDCDLFQKDLELNTVDKSMFADVFKQTAGLEYVALEAQKFNVPMVGPL